MDSTENKSKAKLLIVVGIVVVFAIIAGAVYALVRTNETPNKQTDQTQQNATDKPKENVTQQVLQQDLTDLDSSIKKSQAAHEEAKKAVDDPAKRIKVSE